MELLLSGESNVVKEANYFMDMNTDVLKSEVSQFLSFTLKYFKKINDKILTIFTWKYFKKIKMTKY